jgi:hypothetical protein
VEVVSTDVEVDRAADEGKSGVHFRQGVSDAIHQRLFEVALGIHSGQAKELKVVRSWATCCASSESCAASCCAKFNGADPVRSRVLFMIMFISTFRVRA